MSIIKITLLLCLSFAFAQQKTKTVTKQEKKIVRQILKEQRISEAVSRSLKVIVKENQQKHPGVLDSYLPTFYKAVEIKAVDNVLAPAWYGKYTIKELKSILRFLKTPAGKKFIGQDASVKKEMEKLGSIYAVELYKDLHKRFPQIFILDDKTRKIFNLLRKK